MARWVTAGLVLTRMGRGRMTRMNARSRRPGAPRPLRECPRGNAPRQGRRFEVSSSSTASARVRRDSPARRDHGPAAHPLFRGQSTHVNNRAARVQHRNGSGAHRLQAGR
ncbi:MAG: hypothetical protein MZV70_39485 [Desulfobacterales bacterium]|nr:hypothetical protein [Desulfobacterales bacterium]